jgi:hypothetical protein
MKKTKILYVSDFGELPDCKRYQELIDNLDKDKYEIISDFYAQYDPKAALIDINNYIKDNHIKIVIGERLGGYITSLIDNKNIKKILINPLYDINEFDTYTTTTKNENDEDITVRTIPDHMIDFYKKSDIKPIYDNIICIFTQEYKDNFDKYSLLTENNIIGEDVINLIRNNIL